MAQIPPVSSEPIRELRLALVCYGGVSLAIYMHGTTKEIHKLVRASHAYDKDQSDNPFTGRDEAVEFAYWCLLKQLHERDQVRTRVVVDVVAGTSAGGINGVCLATALANDASQDALRDLWVNEGDIGLLWQPSPSRRLPWKMRAGWWALRSIADVKDASPPLRGDRMCRVLFDTLAGMTRGRPEGATLVPDGLSLDLFVTLTDLRGYRRFVRIKDRMIDDSTHRAVMRFRYDAVGADPVERRDDFTSAHAGALAFAARATSSFPGAFPPIGLPAFAADLAADGQARDARTDVLAGFLPAYRPPYDEPTRAWFIDGGVLDNKPFGHAIDAIVRRPASTEVTRWLVYLEPDPSPVPEGASGESSVGGTQPTLLDTVIPALSGIPRSEPILDELTSLRRFNQRVADVRRVLAPYLAHLPDVLTPLAGLLDAATAPDRQTMSDAMTKVHQQARQDLGATYSTYLRLKLRGVQDALAGALSTAFAFPPESSQADFVRAVVGEWQDAHFGHDPSTEEGLAYINKTDVPYRVRRLRFVVQGVNELYPTTEPAQRTQLDHAKHELYLAIDRLDATLAPDRVRQVLGPEGDKIFADQTLADWLSQDPDPQRFAAEHAQALSDLMAALGDYLDRELQDSSLSLLAHFNDLSRTWEPRLRRTVLVRFLGFPLWDTAVFPLMALSEIQQFSPIQVVRFSPDGATRLSQAGSGKLKGTGIHHFEAFFHRDARESDYLWGRLDGAEQLLALLGIPVDSDGATALLAAILAEEETALRTATGLIHEIRAGLNG